MLGKFKNKLNIVGMAGVRPFLLSGLGRTILIWLLFMTLIPITIVGILSYQNAREILHQNFEEQFIATSNLKSRIIEQYFSQIIISLNQQVKVHSNASFLENLRHFYREGNKSLGDFVNSDRWKKMCAGQANDLKAWKEAWGFYDVFLIDVDGNILFTVTGERDLGVNLLHGEFKQTHFAYALRKARSSGQTIFSDYELYEPSGGKPAGFLVSRIDDESGRPAGFLAVQLGIDRIDSIMHRTRLSDKHKSYLLGKDLRTRSRLVLDDKNVMLRDTIITEKTLNWHRNHVEDNSEFSHSQENGISIYSGPNGKTVLGFHNNISVAGIPMAIVEEIEVEEAFSATNKLKYSILTLLAITCLVALFPAFMIARRITDPIQRLTGSARLIGQGLLDHRTGIERNDEIGQLSKSFDIMAKNLKRITASRDELEKEISIRQATEESLKQYEYIVSSASDMLALLDKNYVFKTANPSYLKAFGLGSGNILNKTALEVFGKDYFERTIKPHASKCMQGESTEYQEWLEFPDKGKRFISFSFYPYSVNESEIKGFVINGRDITGWKNSQEQMKESEMLFRSVFERAAIGVARVAPDGSWLDVNERFCEIVGYSKNELLSKTFLAISHPQDLKTEMEYVNQMLNGEINTHSMEKRFISKQDDSIWVNLSISLVRDIAGKPLYFISIIEDISNRKEAERAIQIERETLSAVFDGVEDIIYIADPETYRLLHVNDAFKKTFSEEAVGRKCHEVIYGKSEPCEFCTNNKIFGRKSGKTHVWEVRNEVTGKWYRCSDKAVTWINGKQVRFELASDITELKLSEQRLKLALDAQQAGIWFWDRESREIRWDRRMENMIGIPDGDFDSTYESWLGKIHPADRMDAKKALDDTIGGRSDCDIVYRVVRDENTELYIQTQSLTMKDMQGKPTLTVGICLDVTEKINSRKELELTLERLNQSNEELEQFAYVASHDLQEPLRMVGSFVQLLQKRYEGRLDNDADEFIAYAVDGANRMKQMINDLLTFSRVGTRGKEFKPVDCNRVMHGVLTDLRNLIQDSDAEIQCDKLPTIIADSAQIAQLFQNLISNAIKYCERTPQINIVAEKSDGDWIFSVEDNGIGVDPKYFDQIFIIFRRLHGKSSYAGSGIGLSVCKKIVNRHGGRLWVESSLGEGSRFYFTIPMATEDNAQNTNASSIEEKENTCQS
ncbi:MAG: PAS domain S-box protein [candidate division Zixibacteria bacterium]|nr:PAS domain S-box protein [candidate division Zixibacteria bacterium]